MKHRVAKEMFEWLTKRNGYDQDMVTNVMQWMDETDDREVSLSELCGKIVDIKLGRTE